MKAIAERCYCSTRVRRNNSRHKVQQLSTKKLFFKYLCCCFCTVLFSFFVSSSSSFAQLTYAHLAVQYDSPWICGKLKLIPVRFKDTGVLQRNISSGGLISFEQALKEGKLSVKEMNLPGGAD